MADYAVATAFTATDQVTPIFDRMSQSAQRFNDRTSSAFRNVTKNGYKFGTIVKGILAANLIRGGIDKVSNGLQKVGTDFLTFDDTIIGAVARFDDIGPGAKNAASMVALMGKEVRNTVKGTRFSAVDAAKAVNELAKASYDSKSAIGILPNMMAFATAGQEDLAEATTMSSDMLGAFNLRDKDTQKQLKNHVELNDMLTKSALLSTGGLRDMFETMKSVAPLAKELRMPKEELLAMGVVLSNAGIKGDMAATALKRASMNIYAGGMAAEFLANGIQIADKETGKLKRLPVILKEIGDKLRPLREDVRVPILRKIFGMYGLAGSYQLMNGLQDISEYTEKIKNSGGISADVSKFQNMSAFAKVVELGNAALEKGFQILEQFNGNGKKGLEGLISRIERFDVKPIVQGLSAAGTIISALYNVIEPFLPILPYLVAGFYGWKLVMVGLTIWPLVQGFAALLIQGPMILGLFNLLTIGWKMFNTAFVTSPLGIALLAGFAIFAAAKSLITGKDNFISETAQSMGLVPKLGHNSEGVVTVYAPNAATAANSQSQFQGQLNITGAPPGSTLTTQQGAPGFNANLLGAN